MAGRGIDAVAGARPGAGRLSGLWAIAKRLFWNQFTDRVGGLAAEISFFAMLSVFPALLVLAAALGSLEDVVGNDLAVRAETLVLGFLNRILTDEAGGAVDAIRGLFEQRRTSLITFASLFAVYGVTRAFAAVINGLDVTHGTREKRSPIRFWSTALALALGSLVATVLLLGVVVIDPLLGGVHGLAERIGLGSEAATAWTWLRWPVAFLLLGGVGDRALPLRALPADPLAPRRRRGRPRLGALARGVVRVQHLPARGRGGQPGPQRPRRRRDPAHLGLPAGARAAHGRRAERHPGRAGQRGPPSALRTAVLPEHRDAVEQQAEQAEEEHHHRPEGGRERRRGLP